jgi:hypothetical protein
MTAFPRRLRIALWACVAAAACGSSWAFLAGGHHYTLLAIYRAGRLDQAVAEDYKRVEAFCAQLPDLAVELDATTQRIKVLESFGDITWGLLGRCGSAKSRHMVASQYHLHALTGTDSKRVRETAIGMLAALQAQFDQAGNDQARVNLACQRGFAAHLLGDTFAHARLDGPDQLYDTGLGHARDLVKPDYMHTRRAMPVNAGGKNAWIEWARMASQAVDNRPLSQAVVDLEADATARLKPEERDPKRAEPMVVNAFRAYATPAWSPYATAIEKWSLPPNSDSSLTVTVRCQQQIDGGPVKQNGTGLAPVKGAKPQCDVVWRQYLALADAQFTKNRVGVRQNSKLGSGCAPDGDQLQDGQ